MEIDLIRAEIEKEVVSYYIEKFSKIYCCKTACQIMKNDRNKFELKVEEIVRKN